MAEAAVLLFGELVVVADAAEGDALATGLAAASGFAFLRVCFAFGEAAGDSAGDGDAAVSAGETVAAAFLCVRCFAGEGD